LTKDLLLSHPLPEHLHIVPTTRDPLSGLALSSRNAYLSEQEKKWAPTLWNALGVGKKVFENVVGAGWNAERREGEEAVQDVRTQVRAAAQEVIQRAKEAAEKDEVSMQFDYIELNWADTLKPVEGDERGRGAGRSPVILSGAIWVGKTRLIDNLIVGDADGLLL
jgi:pantoate--beta-alanine ligase